MVSFDEHEAEVDSEEMDGDGYVTVEVTLTRKCAECGDEMKTSNLTLEGQIDVEGHDCILKDEKTGEEVSSQDDPDRFAELAANAGSGERSWDLNVNVEPADDYRPKVKTRTLKNGTVKTTPVPFRYQRHYLGATATCEARCSICGELETVELSDDMPASGFDDA